MCNCGKKRALAAARAAAAQVSTAVTVRSMPVTSRAVVATPPAPRPALPEPPATRPPLTGRRLRGYMIPRKRAAIALADTVQVILPTVWGPHLWRVLHTVAERQTTATPEWLTVVTALLTSLPCAECTTHFTAWVSAAANAIVVGETDMRAWWLALHNAVNVRTKKAEWGPEQLEAAYGTGTEALAAAASEAEAVERPERPSARDVLAAAMTALEGKLPENGMSALRALVASA